MIERPHLTTIIAIAVATIFVMLWMTGDRPNWRWFSSIGAAVGAVLLSMAIFDKWLWKIPLLQGWFVNRPVLEGDWTGEIRSQWLDPDTEQNPPPIPARISIRQSYSKIHLNLETDQSGGDFVTSTIVRKEDGTYRVVGTYRNEPRLEFRRESPVHLGTMWLDVIGDAKAPTELRGRYWTERQTVGEITALRRTSRITLVATITGDKL